TPTITRGRRRRRCRGRTSCSRRCWTRCWRRRGSRRGRAIFFPPVLKKVFTPTDPPQTIISLSGDAYQEIRPPGLHVIAETRTRLLVTDIGSSNISVQQVICFSDQFLLPKDLRGKVHSPRLHDIAQFPRLLVRQQQRAFANPNHKQ